MNKQSLWCSHKRDIMEPTMMQLYVLTRFGVEIMFWLQKRNPHYRCWKDIHDATALQIYKSRLDTLDTRLEWETGWLKCAPDGQITGRNPFILINWRYLWLVNKLVLTVKFWCRPLDLVISSRYCRPLMSYPPAFEDFHFTIIYLTRPVRSDTKDRNIH